MRNLKKLLAVIVSVCVLATFALPAFAAEQTAAEICEDLGVLKGDSSEGVTDAYLAKGTSRMQAALLYLRLIGKEDEALAFEGEDNFADADQTWAAARPVLAYLKANPELGWQGVGADKFDPKATASAQMMYKVCLEALGYKQDAEDGFKWADVFTFAADKGLSLIADVTDLTNNDVAIALVETLKLNLKDSTTTLAADLVAKGIVTEAAAIAAGLVAAEPDAAIKSVSAIDATTIKVAFDKAVAADAADYKVADSASKDMAVASAASADAGLTVVLKVAEMTVGSKYTVTYGTTSFDVVATVKDDETKPALASAVAITGALVRATFGTRYINQDTLVAANFTLDNDATVTGLKLDTAKMAEAGQEGNTVVLLDVTGLKAGKAYKLTSKSVASYEGAVASTSEATFAGKDADTTAPKISYAKSVAGYQVELKFDEAGIVNETGLDISNYTITPALEITAAKWQKNELGNNIVILTTAAQKAGTAYEISVNNISDGTNVMTSAAKFTFAGLDKATNQELESAVAKNANRVEVKFKYEANDTALDIANYTIDNGITVTAAAFKEDTSEVDKLNQKVVILTTSAMKAGTAYKLTVATGVQDTLGQGLKEAASFTFAGQDPDTSFGSVSAAAESKNVVVVTFSEEVDRATATALVNYSISDLGYPSAISLDSTNKIAKLTVSTQTAGKSYTITLNNIKDLAGNVITANTKVTFTGKGDVVTDLRVTGASALSTDKVKITFNQAIAGDMDDASDVTITNTTTSGETLTFGFGDEIYGADYVVLTVNSATKLNASSIYKVTVVDTDDDVTGALTGHELNAEYDEATFVGSGSAKATFTPATATIIDKNHIKLTFEDALTGGAEDVTNLKVFSNSDYSTVAKDAAGADFATLVNPAEDVVDSGKTVIITTAQNFADNTVYYVEFDGEDTFVNAYGATLKQASDSVALFRAQFVTGGLSAAADVKLAINDVTMMDNNTLKVTFNVDTNRGLVAGDVDIYKDSAATTKLVDTATAVEFTDAKTATIYFNGGNLLTGNEGGIYYLKLINTNLKDITGTSSTYDSGKDVKGFALNTATNAAPAIASVEPLTAKKIKVTTTERIYEVSDHSPLDTADTGYFVIYNATTSIQLASTNYTLTPVITGADANKVFYIELASGEFLTGGNYRIGLTTGVEGIDQVVAAKAYSPATSTDNSIQFGGTGSLAVTVLNTSATIGGFVSSAPLFTNAGVAIANSADVSGNITETSVARAVDTAVYTTANKTITVTLDGAASEGETIVLAAGYYDAAGNAIGARTIKLVSGDWVLQ